MLSLITIVSSASFLLADSILDGGVKGILFDPKSTSFRAVMSNTIVRNMKADAVDGGFGSTDSAGSFQITGGELSNNGGAGVEFGSGAWTFLGVKLQKNNNLGLYSQNAILIMRGCVVSENLSGIDAYAGVAADLGTVSDPGNNVFQGNMLVGVSADSDLQVSAIGNTWNANVQSADASGRYATSMAISGPITAVNGNNFSISAGDSLLR